MLIKRASDIKSSEITPESVYRGRREFMKRAAALGGAAGMSSLLPGIAMAASGDGLRARAPADMQRSAPAMWWEDKFQNIEAAERGGNFWTNEALTPYQDVVTYNNFYEFGMDKGDPSRYAQEFEVDPWSIEITGECDNPATYHLVDGNPLGRFSAG